MAGCAALHPPYAPLMGTLPRACAADRSRPGVRIQFEIVAARLAGDGLSRGCGEEIAQRLDWRVFHDEGLAEAARQDQGDAAVADLLVLAHISEQPGGRDARQPNLGEPRRQAAVFEMAAHPQRVLRR